MTPERFLVVSTVARRLQVSGTAVRNWIHLGRIAFVQTPTGRYKIPASELRRLLRLSQHSKHSQPLS